MSYLESEPNSVQREAQRSHVERRLRIAERAVVDRPINMKFKHGIDPATIRRIPIKSVDSQQEINTANELKELREKLASLEAQFTALIHRLYTVDIVPNNPEPAPTHYPSIAEITKIVCDFYQVSNADIRSHRRTAYVVRARIVAYYLCKIHTLRSYPEIGRMFGGKDHTCPMYGFRKISELRLSDPDLNDALDKMSAQIKAIPNQAIGR